MSDVTTTEELSKPAKVSESKSKKTISILGWTGLTLMCLIMFSIMKLPQARLKNLVQGTIASTLSAQGIQFLANESDLSVGPFGISYTMSGVSLKKPPADRGLTLEKMKVSPSLLAMIFGKVGASFAVYQDSGTLKGAFAAKDSEINLSFDAKELSTKKMGVLPFFAGIQGTLDLDGTGSVSGDFSNPTTVNGSMKLNLSKIIIDAQSIQGFAIPKLSISEGLIDLDIVQGKVTVTSLKLGKPSSQDDIIASVTGDVQLNKVFEMSVVNLKTRFTLSQNIIKAFVLIDAILGAGKQANGSYAYNLNGPINSINPTPGTAQ